MTTAATNYIPGVCNINPAEIRQRQRIGHIGLLLTIVLMIVIFAFQLPWFYGITIFLSSFLSATGYLQAKNKFCVGYAGAKQHHADDGAVMEITEESALRADKLRARTMNSQAFLIAVSITIAACLAFYFI